MKPDDPPNELFATSDDIRAAIESLSEEEAARLEKAATYCLPGTEYQDPMELINEAVVRSMNSAMGEPGRHWPRGVAFVAFMIMTIRGLASDSRDSPIQEKTERLEAMAGEGATAEDALGTMGYSHPCVVEQAVEIEGRQEMRDRAKTDSDVIDAHFANDDEVNWIIMGHKDGQSASEIRELSGMSLTQYETARKRFRRGLEKLFPGRRKS